MDNKINVSVTYTIYGNFDFKRLKTILFYLAKQKEVSFEAIVVNATEKKYNLPSFCKQIFIDKSIAKKNLGLIRNIALKNCSGKYVYTCDADIVFIDKLFLKKLIKLQNETNTALKKVGIFRLPKEEFNSFYNMIEEGIEPKLNESNLSVSLFDNFPFKIKLIEKYAFSQRIDEDDKMPLVHAGCIFGKKEMFENVGGYSEKYVGYGWEDSDLQWKIEEINGIRKIKDLKVLHLDHERGYFNKTQFEKNKKLFFKRVKEGVNKAINYDLDNFVKLNEGGKQIYK